MISHQRRPARRMMPLVSSDTDVEYEEKQEWGNEEMRVVRRRPVSTNCNYDEVDGSGDGHDGDGHDDDDDDDDDDDGDVDGDDEEKHLRRRGRNLNNNNTMFVLAALLLVNQM